MIREMGKFFNATQIRFLSTKKALKAETLPPELIECK
jgi:hypothetical protein